MRVWVSGARGRLGAEVCRQLAAAGHDVVEADVAGDADGSVDLLDRHAVARSLESADAIIHCAGIPSPEGVAPAELVHANTMSTFNALEEGWTAGVRTAVLASSGSIHGTAWSPEPLTHPYVPVDEDSPLQYVDPYALTKDFMERMGQMYARRGMTVTALRFHWILTPDEVSRLIDGISEEEGVRTLWGYVDLEDAARACLLALEPRDGYDAYQTLLITADDTLVTRPTGQLLAEHCPDTELRAPLSGHAGGFDCSRARRVIGWSPRSRRRDT
ncbi:NAD(P)-dependent oxidoreductase [Streptomyces bathyalis]|uniref:NAD(P)-dependent oxidoreductase n=1 Tax=Streptomyces bathyalis TaxID=2710756 RepID=A0A7T1T7I6_9ACTN|nr:NAD(P)-dependent oxidoreductase [Streptomyces bathyalis]QPP07850.1 NAD(P)-dependent oxidoreductase [Streptomyces bathyalis]